MKKVLIPAILLVALFTTIFWFLVRRGPAGGPSLETVAAFKVETFEPGILLQYADGQTPLRALRWLTPLPGSIQPVQILTQSDRQRLVLIQNGAVTATLAISRPSGVREGFFNFAELRDAIVIPGDTAVLLYQSADPSTGELPLIIAMDLATQATRWVHRAPGERLALGGEAKGGSVFLFGKAGILRLPLELQKGERLGNTPFRANFKQMDLPVEVNTLADLLPTGPWSFLLAHAGGLSSYSESKGWKHWPTPAGAPFTFMDSPPALARAKGYWWQPFPGRVVQIKTDGTPIASFDAAALAPAEPYSRDGALLRLRGADPAGDLWFSLATPSTPSSVATPTEPPEPASQSEPGEKTWKPEGPPTVATLPPQEDWSVYCSEGLERIYCWNPEHHTLRGKSLPEVWASLSLPPGMNRPTGLHDFRPESGKILIESGPTAWVLPLEAICLGPISQTHKGQVK